MVGTIFLAVTFSVAGSRISRVVVIFAVSDQPTITEVCEALRMIGRLVAPLSSAVAATANDGKENLTSRHEAVGLSRPFNAIVAYRSRSFDLVWNTSGALPS